jgi:hypothetical protein
VILIELEERCVGSDLGHKSSSRERILIGSYSPPLWSLYLVLQLVSESVWSLVDFNRLCDPNATWKGAVKLVVFNGDNFNYWKN